MVRKMTFCSGRYWEVRYRGGGTPGAGSYGVLARFKAVIDASSRTTKIASVMDLGCGDGDLLSLLTVSGYVGVDASIADFFIYGRTTESCLIRLSAV